MPRGPQQLLVISTISAAFCLWYMVASQITLGCATLQSCPNPDVVYLSQVVPIRPAASSTQSYILHIIDGSTNTELRNAFVYREPTAVGEKLDLLASGNSPLTVNLSDDQFNNGDLELTACASFYTRESFSLSLTDREYWIELSPGGDLDVVIPGLAEAMELTSLTRSHRINPPTYVYIYRATRDDGIDIESLVDTRISETARLQLKVAAPTPPLDRTSARTAARVEVERELDEQVLYRRLGTRVVATDCCRTNATGVVTFIGLLPGHYFVTIEDDGGTGNRIRERCEVDVEAGVRSRIVFSASPPSASSNVQLSGTIRISDSWSSSPVVFEFERLGHDSCFPVDRFEIRLEDLHKIEGEVGLYRFDAGLLKQGRYLVTCPSIGFQQVIDTGRVGTDLAQILVGDPADVIVRCDSPGNFDPGGPTAGVDTRTNLEWSSEPPVDSSTMSFRRIEWDGVNRFGRFKAPKGTILIRPHHNSMPPQEALVVDPMRVTVHAGINELSVRVRPARVLRLFPVINGVVVRPGDISRDSLVSSVRLVSSVDGSNHVFPVFADEYSLHFFVPQPGRYLVDVLPSTGVRVVSAFEVDVGQSDRVALILDRSRL